MNADKIPDIIIGRLPVYLRALQQLSEKGILTTSSQELGEIIGISAAQIRKDISQFGEFGKQGTGYSIPFLIERLRDILKVDRGWEVVVIGMGDIGHALARYNGLPTAASISRWSLIMTQTRSAKKWASMKSLILLYWGKNLSRARSRSPCSLFQQPRPRKPPISLSRLA